MLAAIRPDSWNLPLLLHVLGASILLGALITAVTAQLLAWKRRAPADVLPYARLSFRTLLIVAIPAWLLMWLGALWTASREGLDVSSTVRAPNPTARRTASWLRASPTPRPLTASSTTTSSIQARTPVGILKTTSVSIPTIRPSSRQSRATSTVLAWASTISRIRSGVGKGALRDSCGIKRLKAATSSSSTLLAVATSIPPAEVEPIAVWLTLAMSCGAKRRQLDGLVRAHLGNRRAAVY